MVSSPPPELLPLPPEPLLPDSPHAARAVSRTVAPVSAMAILRFIRFSPEVGHGAVHAGTWLPGTAGAVPGRTCGSARGRRDAGVGAGRGVRGRVVVGGGLGAG